ncbi:Rab proteins geranylgeranyltransferase component A, partial [Tremellales sp. Uapishka_1]
MSAIELESDTYDVVIIGTGLAESIAAAALAKVGKTVLHLDPNEYYGGSQASLTLDELVAWSNKTTPSYSKASTSALTPQLETDRRRYSLSLFPTILPSRGSLISTLISSDVSKYVSFRILDSVGLWDEESGTVRKVPGSKEEVFKDKSISLLDKRRLMKFLLFTAGEFENDQSLQGKESLPLLDFLRDTFQIPSVLASSIIYSIAHSSSASEPTLPALLRTRRYLKSLGRYGNSAFLVGQFGGAGELAQGFCRACAVHGGTYVLGPSSIPESISVDSDYNIQMKLPCHPRPVNARHLIASPRHLAPSLTHPSSEQTTTTTTAHCIALLPSLPETLHAPREEADSIDAAVIVFPPSGEDGNVVRGLLMGEGTGSCPSGQFILYLSKTVSPDDPTLSPEAILSPYLAKLSTEPLFQSYHFAHRMSSSPVSPSKGIIVLDPYHGTEQLTEGLDWESEQGEKAFWGVMGDRESLGEGKGYFVKAEEEDEPDDDL